MTHHPIRQTQEAPAMANPYRLRRTNAATIHKIIDRHGIKSKLQADPILVRDAATLPRRQRTAAFLRAVRRHLPLSGRIEFARDLFAAYRVGALS